MAKKRKSEKRTTDLEQPSAEEQALFEKEMAELEEEFFREQAAERRELQEIAELIPGPDTPNPRDKIWRFLIAEYGFDPKTLWSLSPKYMKLYLEARTERPLPPVAKEDWRSATDAVSYAREKGYKIDLTWISKRKDRIRTRTPTGSSKCHLEVEIHSLCAILVKEAPRTEPKDEDEPDETARAEIEARKEAAKHRKHRSLD